MSHEPTWRRALRFWGPNVAADVDEELRFHLETRIEALTREGLDPATARARAEEEFGDVPQTARRLRAIGQRRTRRDRRWLTRQNIALDLRQILRGFRASPAFTLAVVLTLGVGIGAVTAMYGVMSRLLLQPPPHVAEAGRVVKLFFRYERAGSPAGTIDATSYPLYVAMRDGATSVAAMAAYAGENEIAVGEGVDAELARATLVSAGFGRVTGVRPALGRWIADDEADPFTGARVAVLADGFWRRQFGADPGVVGRTIRVKGLPYRVIGVTPRGFRGIDLADTDLFLPLMAADDGGRRPGRSYEMASSSNLRVAARLAPGATPGQAAAELGTRFARALDESERADAERNRAHFGSDLPAREPYRMTVLTAPIRGALAYDMTRRPEATVAVWLVGVSAVLLAIACANVASLFLLRAMRRRREIAIRLALGMSRRRLVALLLAESGALALLGGVAAVAVVIWGGAWVNRYLLPDLAWEAATLDWSLFALAAGCTIGVALLAGLVPALQLRRDTEHALRDGAPHGSTRRSRLHAGLLVAQTALSVLLLVGAGLFLRSMQQLRAHDYGMDIDGVTVVQVLFDGSGWRGRAIGAFHDQALERLRRLPGVERAALATSVPLRGLSGAGLTLPDGHKITGPDGESSYGSDVTPGFVSTVGLHLVAGRDIGEADRQTGAIVINQTMARIGWPGRSPIGECAHRTGNPRCAPIVGVVADPSTGGLASRGPRMLFYSLLEPGEADGGAILLRTRDGMAPSAAAIRQALESVQPGLPYVRVESLGAVLEPQLRPWRLGATVFTAFGVLAALLAGLGLYAAIAYAVTQRTREIGVRVAVGAGRRDVLTLVIGDGVRIAAVGLVLGAGAALFASRWITDLLFEVSPREPRVYVAVGIVLLLVSLVATLMPAWRATRVDPVIALRAE